MAACCAAYGVPLREPLKPDEPAEAQLTTRPSGSVSVMIVLLNVAWMQTSPCGTIRFSFFLRNSFFRLAGLAPAAGAAAASLGSFAMSSCRTFQDAGRKNPGATFKANFKTGPKCLPSPQRTRVPYTLLASHGLLLGCNGALARTFAGARIRVRALAAHRKIPAMAQ